MRGRQTAILALVLASVVVAAGTFWAFQRGANDFAVFHAAWKLVLTGRPLEIYSATPDRFLYAPGFAWLLAPLGLFPKGVALALWCLAKAAVVGLIIRDFTRRMVPDPFLAMGIGAWGVLIVARPLLIDFQYGQVNTFILGACVWALLGHFSVKSASAWDFTRWFVLAVAAVAKVFPLPLLLIPWVPWSAIPRRRLRLERAGSLSGIAAIGLAPLLTAGTNGTLELFLKWRDALLARGLPLESHNQSFTAFLHHYFSGEPTPVIAKGSALLLGSAALSRDTIGWLSLGWTAVMALALLALLVRGQRIRPMRWMAVVTGFLILPSHLVWKPYFVFGLPLAILAAYRYGRGVTAWIPILIFAMINLTGFDFIGPEWGARAEAAALLLWGHLGLMIAVLWPDGFNPFVWLWQRFRRIASSLRQGAR